MRKKRQISAGVLVYRRNREGQLEVLLAHPGGPFWKSKDLAAWTIPKGLVEDGEDFLVAAKRELMEEVGLSTEGPYHSLGTVETKGGKTIHAWAVEIKPSVTFDLKSNLFECEWPPKSGKMRSFPEIDRCEFFSLMDALQKIHPSQVPVIQRFEELINSN